MSSIKQPAPSTEAALIDRCQQIMGLNFLQLSMMTGLSIPENPTQRKGWVGQAIELALGADAGSKAVPDFQHLGIELKTIPLAASGKPSESTFITSIPLLTLHQQSWHTSQCYAKLKRMLWLPIEGDTDIPYMQRRIGQGFLWSPNPQQESILKADWTYLSDKICTGYLESIDASQGDYLQVRPKGANGKSLCDAFDAEGNKIKTLPRGFYLRSKFTADILASEM